MGARRRRPPPPRRPELAIAARSATAHVVIEELDAAGVEAIVAVAGHHVPGAGDVDLLGMRQYQRPSSMRRRFFWSPERSFGRGRCGLHEAMASAADSRSGKPPRPWRMKARMRAAPAISTRGAMSTNTRPLAMSSSHSPTASRLAIRLSEAPTSAGLLGNDRASARTSSA
jgi:hypothetical protein